MEHPIQSILTKVLNPSVIGQRDAEHDTGRRRKWRIRRREKCDRAADHVPDISRALEYLNRDLESAGSPYRVYIKEQDSRIFINLCVLSDEGYPETEKIVDITDADYTELINHIVSAQGFLFDGSV